VRIGIDVDDVVLDLLTAWLNRYNTSRKFKGSERWTPELLTCWKFQNDLGCTAEELFSHLTPSIYKEVKPYPDAAEALDAIEALGHEVVFVTSCPDADHAIAKENCLARYGLLKNRSTVFVGDWAAHQSKSTVAVDWLVDDHIGNVESFPGHALLLTRPHNQRLQCLKKRIKKLSDVARELEFCKPPEPVTLAQQYFIAEQETRALKGLSKVAFGGTMTEALQATALPTDRQERKNIPIVSGCLDYFSAALAEVAKVSMAGNKQHFTNEPLHWQRGLSGDHADAAGRHLMERGTLDTDGVRHSAKMAWRALALLQEELEAAGAPLSRASRPAA
jgi:5'(3')-deoxyribonucleotidase